MYQDLSGLTQAELYSFFCERLYRLANPVDEVKGSHPCSMRGEVGASSLPTFAPTTGRMFMS